MIAGQVGEGGGVEAHAVDAPLVEGVRGHLHAHAFGTEGAQRCELAVNAHRIRSGVQRGSELCGHAYAERSEEHTSELQSQSNLVCRLLLEKKNTRNGC